MSKDPFLLCEKYTKHAVTKKYVFNSNTIKYFIELFLFVKYSIYLYDYAHY